MRWAQCLLNIADENDENNFLVEDCKQLSEKGLYCFDMSEKAGIDYDLISCPQTPLRLEMLPSHIMDILQTHVLNVDFANSNDVKLDR